jgi:hypothetical protein
MRKTVGELKNSNRKAVNRIKNTKKVRCHITFLSLLERTIHGGY